MQPTPPTNHRRRHASLRAPERASLGRGPAGWLGQHRFLVTDGHQDRVLRVSATVGSALPEEAGIGSATQHRERGLAAARPAGMTRLADGGEGSLPGPRTVRLVPVTMTSSPSARRARRRSATSRGPFRRPRSSRARRWWSGRWWCGPSSPWPRTPGAARRFDLPRRWPAAARRLTRSPTGRRAGKAALMAGASGLQRSGP
jgi:hypothetical protein